MNCPFLQPFEITFPYQKKPERANFHTHSLFCDGKNSPEEMVKAALERGLKALGFSSHASFPIELEGNLPNERYQDYLDEIKRLRSKYEGQIPIYCGFEADYLSGVTEPDSGRYARFSPDFLIGSIHFLPRNQPGSRFAIDGSAEELAQGLHEVFHDDAQALIHAYFSLEREMIQKYDFPIIGHSDLFRKRNGVLHFFNEADTWYKDELEETADVIQASGKIVEINTGGMARGAINDTYPSLDYLRILCNRKVPFILSADAHAAQAIDYAFDYAFENVQRASAQR